MLLGVATVTDNFGRFVKTPHQNAEFLNHGLRLMQEIGRWF
jgi:hypothetical protein